MRSILTTALVAGFCAMTFAGSLAGAELHSKIDNVTKLDWLELRTKFAASEGPIAPDVKANHRSAAEIGATTRDPVPSGLILFGSDLHSAWDLVRQQAQLAAKFTSKHLDPRPADQAALELSWGWQHES